MNHNTIRTYWGWAPSLAILAVTSSVVYGQGQPLGRATGRIVDDAGAAVPGAWIFLGDDSREAVAKGAGGKSWRGEASADGSFDIGDLPDGAYRFCVQVPSTMDLLSTCLWGTTGPAVLNIRGGKVVETAPIELQRGFRTKVRVVDPAGQIRLNNLGEGEGHILVGVFTPARQFAMAELVSVSPSERLYEMVLPFGQPVNVTAASGYFRLANDSGQGLNEGRNASTAVTIARGGREQVVTLRITGVHPR